MKIKIKRLNGNAKIPTRGSDFAAGYDLYAEIPSEVKTVGVHPGETIKFCTGIAMEIPEGYFGAVYARSGLSTKKGLRPANCVGVVDSDYRGEVCVFLHNDSDKTWAIENHDRIAQLVIQKFEPVKFEEVDELSDTSRGTDGFGSTGK